MSSVASAGLSYMYVLAVTGPIVPADIPVLCERVRRLLEKGETDLVVCDVSALRDADAVTVDAFARLQLTAKRLGRCVGLSHPSEELRGLLELTGLSEIMQPLERSALQPSGEAEERKEPVGVEEEADAGDTAL